MLPMWRLIDRRGIPVQCAIAEHDRGWVVLVIRGRDITFYECCPSDTSAVRRTHEIWTILVEQGWTERRH